MPLQTVRLLNATLFIRNGIIMFGEFLPREPTQMEQVIEQVSGVSYSSWIYRVSIGDVLKFLFATILTIICLVKAIRNDP